MLRKYLDPIQTTNIYRVLHLNYLRNLRVSLLFNSNFLKMCKADRCVLNGILKLVKTIQGVAKRFQEPCRLFQKTLGHIDFIFEWGIFYGSNGSRENRFKNRIICFLQHCKTYYIDVRLGTWSGIICLSNGVKYYLQHKFKLLKLETNVE